MLPDRLSEGKGGERAKPGNTANTERTGLRIPGSGLELNLVSNPNGAFLPAGQAQAEIKFRGDLQRKHGIRFNDFYTLTNAPLGRFRRWLVESGNYQSYMEKLASSFNPCTIPGLMCRSLISISWDGYVFDCDFHLSTGLHACGRKTHISQLKHPPAPGAPSSWRALLRLRGRLRLHLRRRHRDLVRVT